ncbi:golgin subfamily A member 6-like protein 22 [Dendronephthya gigantea]|uniref:golgin subfamily A member 6-like protein 22 n=1 Tax=Dendronephthya gigantea TaxID=151771 RepID=UPI001069E12E|nr:golgin subfamily A member 6-like protein 22 [Dendronephthya gigantea]
MSDDKNMGEFSRDNLEQLIANLCELKPITARLRETVSRIEEKMERYFVNLGILAKDFDAITRDNIESEDVKNHELYDKVKKLQEEITQCDNHIRELEAVLASSENELALKVNEMRLQSSNIKIDKNILEENKNLRDRLEHENYQPTERQDASGGQTVENAVVEEQISNEQEVQALQTQVAEQGSEIVKLKNALKNYEANFKSENEEKEKIKKQLHESNQECERLTRENQSHLDEIHRFESEKKDLNERVTAQQNEILEHENRVKALEAILADLSRIIHNLLMKNKESSIFCKKLLDSRQKLFRASETHQPGNPLPELDQGNERSTQLNQECERLRREKQRNIETIRRMNEMLDERNETIDEFCAQVSAKEDTMAAMKDRLKTCEADFKNEHEEKEKIQRQLNESNQESERLRRENQSHMATVRHFKSEIEGMKKLLNEKNKSKPNIGFPFGQPVGSSVPQSFFRDRRQSPQTLMIKCSYCSRSYPYHLFEGHVQDCMEDSLYMDD